MDSPEPHAAGAAVTCLVALGPSAIATGGSDGLVCCWRLATDASGGTAVLVATLGTAQACTSGAGSPRVSAAPADEVRAVAALEHGRLCVASWSGRLALWCPDNASWALCGGDVAYALAASWEAHLGPAWALCALPERECASGGRAVKVWSPDGPSAPAPRLILRCPSSHGGEPDITALCLLKCERILASGGTDAAVRLWRVSDGQCLAQLFGHGDSVTALAPTVAGGVASASGDRSLRVWPPPDPDDSFSPDPGPPSPAQPPQRSRAAAYPDDPAAQCAATPQCLPGTPPLLLSAASFNLLGFLANLRGAPKALQSLFRPAGERSSSSLHDALGAYSAPTVLAAHANPVTALTSLPDGRLLSAAVGACVWAPVAEVAGAGGGGAWRCVRLLGEGPSARHHPVAALAALPRPPGFLGDPIAAPGCLAAAVAGGRLRVWDVNGGSVVADAMLTRHR